MGQAERTGTAAPVLIKRGKPGLIKPENELRAPEGTSLTATYDIKKAVADTLRLAQGVNAVIVLEVDVVIDGAVSATHTTQAAYITVGRSHRDICIDRPDISRSHGAFQLDPDGWKYCQHSSGPEAQVLRDGHVPAARVRQDEVEPVKPGDIVCLTAEVSLVLR